MYLALYHVSNSSTIVITNYTCLNNDNNTIFNGTPKAQYKKKKRYDTIIWYILQELTFCL